MESVLHKEVNVSTSSRTASLPKKKPVLELAKYRQVFARIRSEVGKAVIGQGEIVNSVMEAVIANGHVLVEGVPGTGKTLLVKTVAKIMGAQFSRIQFTPDLLPTDILGITTYEEGKGFYTVKGPIFANFVLADEINRSPPKVQSALLESMQERQVTIGKETFILPTPFFVMATQNPLEQLGTYKLPEAQVDRFIYKIIVKYPTLDEEQKILNNNMTTKNFSDFDLTPVIDTSTINELQEVVKKIPVEPRIEEYIVRIIDATRNPQKYRIELGKYISFGASPRSSIAIYITSKARAMIEGRNYVTPYDVKKVAHNVLRHRIILNFEGEAENISTDDIISQILDKIPIM